MWASEAQNTLALTGNLLAVDKQANVKCLALNNNSLEYERFKAFHTHYCCDSKHMYIQPLYVKAFWILANQKNDSQSVITEFPTFTDKRHRCTFQWHRISVDQDLLLIWEGFYSLNVFRFLNTCSIFIMEENREWNETMRDMYPSWTRIRSIPLSGLNGFKIRLMCVFVPIYKQKLHILKIELFLGIHTILWHKKSALKCFKCYSEKRLHNFGNRLEIGTTIINQWDICRWLPSNIHT